MPSSLIELRPDRRLLDHEFEGYKLDLQALPHFSSSLPLPVDRVFPDDVQYSFIHAKLFALHNHLTLDYWDYSYKFYYINNKRQVCQQSFETDKTFRSAVVYTIPSTVERKSGHFNLCLSFVSQGLAVVSDGAGYLHIVDTGPRNKPEESNHWQTLHSSLVLGEGKYFVILDSRLQEKNSKQTLHCLLQSVEQTEKHFSSVLTWVSFENTDHTWSQVSLKELKGKGIIHYAAIETSCEALYIASDNAFTFTHDTEKNITEPETEDLRKIIYTWLQTSEDITLTLKLEAGFDKKLVHVDVSPLQIKVSYAGKSFIEGKLRHKVDSEFTTWNVQDNGQVDILVTKTESMLWDELLEGGDAKGEQVMDASLVEEAHRRLAHLCAETEVTPDLTSTGLSTQELEECDAPSEEDTVLVRINATNHQITHRAPLSVHQYLFNIKIETEEVPALALRHDVDACIWQPYSQLINEMWPVKHQGTLKAFGYVQSSKQNRKFVTCPPNFTYSVVCEASRHIFIYQSSGKRDCELRKRTAGVMKPIKVGQQHVFNIENYGEVIGINATNEYLFILTESSLIAIHIV
ncbi:nudC domain-containing protein 1 [Ostrinia nubilalis]|uniref:nudC domain-containing protein 1 n=1 Tax=Ostrinia nubilalis TaxID=29057 RepID=UPI0030826B96